MSNHIEETIIFFDVVNFLIQNDIAIPQSDENFNPISFLKALLVMKYYNNTINIYN